MSKQINVVLTSSDYYAPYTSVTIASILYNLPQNRDIYFHVITEDMSNINKIKIDNLKKIHNFDIEYLTVSCDELNLPKAPQERVSNIAYARLKVSSLFPDLKKCIICDSDLVFDYNIEELFDMDIGNKAVAIAKDPLQREGKNYWWESFDIDEKYPYLNTGVILMDVEKIRKNELENKIFENYGIYRFNLHFIDQDLFYLTLSEYNKILDDSWNFLPNIYYSDNNLKSELSMKAKVFHFGGGLKPWCGKKVDFSYIWWKYAAKSPFYEDILANIFMSKTEMFRVHFPNINTRFAADEYNTKLLYVLTHTTNFKLKKVYYKLKKIFTFGERRQKYQTKYNNVKILLKDARKFKKNMY